MAKQEEIMRQQMEELKTTQEESARRESEISGILNAVHNSSLVAEYNMNEELITINDKFVSLLEGQRVNLIGKRHHELAGVSRYADSHIKFWEEIRQGKTISKVENQLVSPEEGMRALAAEINQRIRRNLERRGDLRQKFRDATGKDWTEGWRHEQVAARK